VSKEYHQAFFHNSIPQEKIEKQINISLILRVTVAQGIERHTDYVAGREFNSRQ
jgi:hypothetical protein